MLDYTRERLRQIALDTSQRVIWPAPRNHERRILVVQMEGLGNAILTTPMVSALSMLNPRPIIDVLLDRSRASDFVFADWPLVNRIWDAQEMGDLSTLAPYDFVIECHPRRDLPKSVRFRKRLRIGVKTKPNVEYHWCFEKHEAEYLVDLARTLGYVGERPPIRKLVGRPEGNMNVERNTVAIGIGYLKRPRSNGCDWSDRHWGNENFARLCYALEKLGYFPVLVGDTKDQEKDGYLLASKGIQSVCGSFSLAGMAYYLSKCTAFIGNDTGLMHLAASVGIPTIGIFVSTNSVKSYPLGPYCIALGGDAGMRRYQIEVDRVIEAFETLLRRWKPC